MQEISTTDAHPSVTRVSDADETAFSFATQKKSPASRRLVTKACSRCSSGAAGTWTRPACPSSATRAAGPTSRAQKAIVEHDRQASTAASCVGNGPGALYDQKKFDTPYIRDFLLDRGARRPTSPRPRRRGRSCCRSTTAVRTAAARPSTELGRHGLRHVPPLALLPLRRVPVLHLRLRPRRRRPARPVRRVKCAIQQTFIDNGGTLSHHHGVGHRARAAGWSRTSPRRAWTMVAVLHRVDPGRNLNPGTLIPASREWSARGAKSFWCACRRPVACGDPGCSR